MGAISISILGGGGGGGVEEREGVREKRYQPLLSLTPPWLLPSVTSPPLPLFFLSSPLYPSLPLLSSSKGKSRREEEGVRGKVAERGGRGAERRGEEEGQSGGRIVPTH